MFVDKNLSGVKAVQTLSRLNRIAPDKDDTFILDFVNDAETIQKSFEPYFESTVLTEGVDPNAIYDIKARLDGYKLWTKNEVDRFAEIFYGSEGEVARSGSLSSILQLAAIRFNDIEDIDDEGKKIKIQIKKDINYFIRIYSFITQIERMFDEDMQKFYTYANLLMKALPEVKVEKVNVDQLVVLEYYKIMKARLGCIPVDSKGKISPIKGSGGGIEDDKESFSEIVRKINEAFGTDFTEMDKVLEQIANDMRNDEEIAKFAMNNDQSTFSVLFEKKFEDIAAARYMQNDSFFDKMFKDEKFMNAIKEELLNRVYRELVSGAR